jgi:hypothetical protein
VALVVALGYRQKQRYSSQQHFDSLLIVIMLFRKLGMVFDPGQADQKWFADSFIR